MALLQIPDGLPDFKPVKKKGKRKTFYDYFLVFPFSFFLNMIMTFLFSTTIGNARRMVGSARTGWIQSQFETPGLQDGGGCHPIDMGRFRGFRNIATRSSEENHAGHQASQRHSGRQVRPHANDANRSNVFTRGCARPVAPNVPLPERSRNLFIVALCYTALYHAARLFHATAASTAAIALSTPSTTTAAATSCSATTTANLLSLPTTDISAGCRGYSGISLINELFW